MRSVLSILLILFVAGCGSDTKVREIHNGLSFEMKKNDVEKLGFVCSKSKKDDWYSFRCNHMEKSGELFGLKTSSYFVLLSKDSEQVELIGMSVVGVLNRVDVSDLVDKFEKFFPERIFDSGNTPKIFGVILGNSKGEKIAVDHFVGVPGILKAETSISFWSSTRPWSSGKK
jgi:hypothetical protein